MSRDQYSTTKGKRTPTRRRRTQSLGPTPSLLGRGVPSAGGHRSRRSGKRAGTAGHRRNRTQYYSAASGVLPRLRLQALDLTPSRATAMLLLGVMIVLLVWFFVDESFFVYTAEVRGNSLVTAEEVYRAGSLDSMSIFYINRHKVARDIERLIPGVTQVRVQCQLPGRVSVHIREQDVRYVWRSADAAFLVDGEGRILKVDDGTHAGLLVIQDLGRQSGSLDPGDQVDRTTLNAVSRLHGLLPEVQIFEYSEDRGVSVSDARGWRVYFGDDQELAEKVAILQALLPKVLQEGKTVKVIDLRFVESPYYQ